MVYSMIFKEKVRIKKMAKCMHNFWTKKPLLCSWLDMNYGFKRFVASQINHNAETSHTDVHWGWPRCVLHPLLCLDFYCVHYEYYWPLKHVFCRLFCILPFWVSGLNNLDNHGCNAALKSSPSVEVVHATCVHSCPLWSDGGKLERSKWCWNVGFCWCTANII